MDQFDIIRFVITRIGYHGVIIINRNRGNGSHQILHSLHRLDGSVVFFGRWSIQLRRRVINGQNSRGISTMNSFCAHLPDGHEVPIHSEDLSTEEILVPIVRPDCVLVCVVFVNHVVLYTSQTCRNDTSEQITRGVIIEAAVADGRSQLFDVANMTCLKVDVENGPAGADEQRSQTIR